MIIFNNIESGFSYRACRTQYDNFFFHNVNDFKNKKKVYEIIKILKKFKRKKLINKIGISLNSAEEIIVLKKKFIPDIVQIPFNLLDRRIVTSGWYNKLKLKKIEVHARSIFAKGLLVNNKFYKEKLYFKKWQKIFSNWFYWLNKCEINPIDYCLNDLQNYDFDKIVIGINSKDNLQKIINFKKIKFKNKVFKFNINDKKLLDPRKWH